ncbi:hypothetical protein ABZ654_23770 [Streptomyces hygroscopicus]|uniref:hypothetical protein n=1 Tax=Streptomyces hygroscopicus TaxID=1912 RepID=UPI0033ECF875
MDEQDAGDAVDRHRCGSDAEHRRQGARHDACFAVQQHKGHRTDEWRQGHGGQRQDLQDTAAREAEAGQQHGE